MDNDYIKTLMEFVPPWQSEVARWNSLCKNGSSRCSSHIPSVILCSSLICIEMWKQTRSLVSALDSVMSCDIM